MGRKEIVDVLMSDWIVILNLTNWDIEYKLASEEEIKKVCVSNGLVLGCNNYDYYAKKSNIYILENIDISELKNTVIHELLHLVLSDLDRIEINTTSNVFHNKIFVDFLEVAINQLSQSFIKADIR